MQFRSAFLINSGLGAGNIGDELTMRGLWSQLPPDFKLHVGVFENYRLQREPYPDRFTYHPHVPGTVENAWATRAPGLLAGSGLIFDRPGAQWPLGFLAPRLQHFHDHGLPVDAVGVTVEPIASPENRRLFETYLRPVRSWSVCDQPSAAILTGLGVDPRRVVVGAEWAWLYESPSDFTAWASELWLSLGVDLGRPLLAVNVFWPPASDTPALSAALAAALDSLHRLEGFQIAFLPTDFRHPGFHRSAAENVHRQMSAPAVHVPNEYYSPGELIALLRFATVSVGRPHYFGVASIMADTPPVFLSSRSAGPELCLGFGLSSCGSANSLNPDDISNAVKDALRLPAGTLQAIRQTQAAQARRNLDLFGLYHGYRLSSAAAPAESAAR